MKIALVTHWLSKSGGGISTAVEELSGALKEQCARVDVYGLSDPRWKHDRTAWAGAPARAFPVIGPKALGMSPQLRATLLQSDADIVHYHGLWMHVSSDVTAWAKGRKPFVVSPHGMLDPWALKRSAIKKRLARLLYEDRTLRNAACIHVLNQAEAHAARSFGLRNPICVVPNGVALPPDYVSSVAPWEGAFEDDARVLLFLGRLHPKKNVHGLIDAFAALKRDNALADWRLVVAGWGDDSYRAKLIGQIDERELAHEVALVGPLYGPKKDAALRRASAFVLPSFSEGLPMAVLEAWANCLPVAMTSACNLPEGFSQRAAVKVGTEPLLLAAGLKDFLSRAPEALAEMGARGRALVERKFSWDAVAAELIGVYSWIIGAGPTPECVR